MNNLEAYKRWVESQRCVDCGRRYADRRPDEMWATEVQCFECWKKHGAPEKRGKPGASDLAKKAGVEVY